MGIAKHETQWYTHMASYIDTTKQISKEEIFTVSHTLIFMIDRSFMKM